MVGAAVLAALLISGTPVRDGSRSVVRLVEVARLTKAETAKMRPPAEDGLRFVFVASRKPGAAGLPTITETRSLDVGGRRYPPAEPSLPEPETVVYDLAEFRATVRPDLSARLPPGDEATVVVLSIGGPALLARASGQVRLTWGWDKVTEDFWFEFNVPVKSSLPRQPGGAAGGRSSPG